MYLVFTILCSVHALQIHNKIIADLNASKASLSARCYRSHHFAQQWIHAYINVHVYVYIRVHVYTNIPVLYIYIYTYINIYVIYRADHTKGY